MDRLKKIKRHHIIAILVIALILYVIIGRIFTVQERKHIFKNGQSSVCKVYHVHCDGEVKICDGDYFFYYQGRKYFSYYIIEPNNINPVGKYYKVFFLPRTPNKSVVDYSLEISTDSVYKYFPLGQNPFEKELKQDSIRRLRGN